MERPILIQGAEETEVNYLKNIIDDIENVDPVSCL